MEKLNDFMNNEVVFKSLLRYSKRQLRFIRIWGWYWYFNFRVLHFCVSKMAVL